MQTPHLPLWSMYLDHIRRLNNLTTDTSGQARQTIHQAYDLALHQVGLDKESGKLWQDYVQFIKSGPGVIGGSNWQDQQKMDLLRKTYQRTICIPTQSTNLLWKEYDGFEMGLNKTTVRVCTLLYYLLLNYHLRGANSSKTNRPPTCLHAVHTQPYKTSHEIFVEQHYQLYHLQ